MEEIKLKNNEEIETLLKEIKISSKKVEKKYPVLIIDDDIMFQRLCSNYLKSWGFEPITAENPFKGIALAIRYRPVLILLDILMPEVNGDILLKMFKEIEQTANIPVLIISANLNKNMLNSTWKGGACEFISKPFTKEILFQKIQKCIRPKIFNKIKDSDLSSTENIE